MPFARTIEFHSLRRSFCIERHEETIRVMTNYHYPDDLDHCHDDLDAEANSQTAVEPVRLLSGPSK